MLKEKKNMDVRKLNYQDILVYPNEIKKYFKNVLEENFLDEIKMKEIEENYKKMLAFTKNESALIYGAIDEGLLIGFLWAYQREVRGESRYHISYYVVNEKFRNQGIGKKMLELLITEAKKKSIKKIDLVVSNNNKNGLEFYKKNEFLLERVFLCKDL